MRKFLLSAIGLFISTCVATQFTNSQNNTAQFGKNVFKDSLPKDGTIISYSYVPKDHAMTDTMFKCRYNMYSDTCRAMQNIKLPVIRF